MSFNGITTPSFSMTSACSSSESLLSSRQTETSRLCLALASFIRSDFQLWTYGSTSSKRWSQLALTASGTMVDYMTLLTELTRDYSIYIHCESRWPHAGFLLAETLLSGGLTNPAPGVLDFNDWRALQPIYDAAKLAGIFIVLRPGPYVSTGNFAFPRHCLTCTS